MRRSVLGSQPVSKTLKGPTDSTLRYFCGITVSLWCSVSALVLNELSNLLFSITKHRIYFNIFADCCTRNQPVIVCMSTSSTWRSQLYGVPWRLFFVWRWARSSIQNDLSQEVEIKGRSVNKSEQLSATTPLGSGYSAASTEQEGLPSPVSNPII